MPRFSITRPLLGIALGSAALILGGCSTLPRSGPTRLGVVNAAEEGQFKLVEVDSVEAIPAVALPTFRPFAPASSEDADQLQPGDVLSVTVYEVGVRLFAGQVAEGDEVFNPSAQASHLGALVIDPQGFIRLPYGGALPAAGRTTRELALAIEQRLRGLSESPQVMVQRDAAIGSGIMISGEVAQPGRIPLSAANSRLLDIITLAGGNKGSTDDLLVRVLRDGQVSEGPYEAMSYSTFGNMVMQPGDRIELVRQPRAFSVLGSANQVRRFDLPLRQVSLADGIAAAGGPNDNQADAGAIFVFRFVNDEATQEEVPTVYHFNMIQPASYLLAQKFDLQDDDVIYVASARANQSNKLLQLISQIFTPIVFARQITK